MQQWCLIKNDQILDGPHAWEPAIFSRMAYSACGMSYSFPRELMDAIVLRDGAAIVPVRNEVVFVPGVAEADQLVDRTETVVGDSEVTARTIMREKSDGEKNPTLSGDTLERMALENKYLLATKQLCELAGDEIPEGTWPKLEDVEFEIKAITATKNAPTLVPLLLATLNYTYFQLKLRNWEWEQIEHRELGQ